MIEVLDHWHIWLDSPRHVLARVKNISSLAELYVVMIHYVERMASRFCRDEDIIAPSDGTCILETPMAPAVTLDVCPRRGVVRLQRYGSGDRLVHLHIVCSGRV